MVKIDRVLPLRPKMAFLRGPHLHRALSVWAENWYGNSLGQDKALTQFSAQTDSTRRRWSLRKIAKIAFFAKWAKTDILRKNAKKWRFFDQKRKILHRFLSQLMLTISVSFEQFVFSFNFFDPFRHFGGLFFLSRYQSFLVNLPSFLGNFTNSQNVRKSKRLKTAVYGFCSEKCE